MTARLTGWIAAHGVAAVFLLMAPDAVAVADGRLSLLGHTLSHGLGSYVVLVAASTLGYVAGLLVGWGIGVRGRRGLIDRHGGKLHLGPARFAKAERWFARFGPATAAGASRWTVPRQRLARGGGGARAGAGTCSRSRRGRGARAT